MQKSSSQIGAPPDIVPRVEAPEAQAETAAVADPAGGLVHQIQKDAAQPAATGLFTKSPLLVGRPMARLAQADLTAQTQGIVGHHAQQQQQGVGGELARRQAFQVQVRLQLGVELLAGAVLAVEPDHVLGRRGQIRPPGLHLDLGDQQHLTVGADRASHDLEDDLFADVLPLADQRAGEDLFAGPRTGAPAQGQGLLQPDLLRFLAQVALDDEVGLGRALQLLHGGDVVVGAVHAHQQLVAGDAARLPQRLSDELRGAFLRMLTALAQLAVDQVPFLTQVGEDRGKAVDLLVGIRHPLFLRVRVVEHRHVDIQRDPGTAASVGDFVTGSDRRRVPGHQVGRLFSNRVFHRLGHGRPGQGIEPLPQGGRRRHRLQAQRLDEEGIVPKGFHGLEIRLAQGQQTDHRGQHVAVRNRGLRSFRQGDLIDPRGQARAAHQGADQGQPRMRRERFVALRDFIRNRSQSFHLRGEWISCPTIPWIPLGRQPQIRPSASRIQVVVMRPLPRNAASRAHTRRVSSRSTTAAVKGSRPAPR